MSARTRACSRARLTAALLCLLALAAVAVTASAAVHSWQDHHRAPDPPAPGLAALSDDELAALMPGAEDLPPDWVLTEADDAATYTADERGWFAYNRLDTALGPGSILGFTPSDCDRATHLVSTGGMSAAQIGARDQVDPADTYDGNDIRLTLEREFDPAGFDGAVALVKRCREVDWTTARFHSHYTVDILEDSTTGDAPQRFRYSVTIDDDESTTAYYSYARTGNLILTGVGSPGHRQAFDAVFDQTLERVQAGR